MFLVLEIQNTFADVGLIIKVPVYTACGFWQQFYQPQSTIKLSILF